MVARAGRRGRRGWRRSGLCRRGDVLFVADVPSAPDEAAVLRAANARLREGGEAKDTEIAALRAAVEAGTAALARPARLGRGLGLRGPALGPRVGVGNAHYPVPPPRRELCG